MNATQRLIQQGMQQGIQAINLEIAKQMLSNMHLDIRTVSQATGLSVEKLEQLLNTSK